MPWNTCFSSQLLNKHIFFTFYCFFTASICNFKTTMIMTSIGNTFPSPLCLGFIKSDLRRQKANLKSEVQTVSVSPAVCASWSQRRHLHMPVQKECVRCRSGSGLDALSSHCCRHACEWMQGLHCYTGGNFLSLHKAQSALSDSFSTCLSSMFTFFLLLQNLNLTSTMVCFVTHTWVQLTAVKHICNRFNNMVITPQFTVNE